MMTKTRTNWLTVNQQFNLNHACRLITAAFGQNVYQVGSSLQRPDFRDVDVRCLLRSEEFRNLIGVGAEKHHRKLFLNTVISEYLQARTGLPVDFQFQWLDGANLEYKGNRIPLGDQLKVKEESHDESA